jgi:ankyrin repeat protein
MKLLISLACIITLLYTANHIYSMEHPTPDNAKRSALFYTAIVTGKLAETIRLTSSNTDSNFQAEVLPRVKRVRQATNTDSDSQTEALPHAKRVKRATSNCQIKALPRIDNAKQARLDEAVQKGDIDQVKKLVVHKTNVNAQNDRGATLLHRAALSNQDRSEIIKELVKNKADLNIITFSSGNTPLHLVETLKNAQALIEAGANPNAQRHLDGRTPLHMALLNSDGINLPLIRFLITCTDLSLQDNGGNTPLHLITRIPEKDITTLQAFIDRANQTQGKDLFNIPNKKEKTPKDLLVNIGYPSLNYHKTIKYLMERNIEFEPAQIRSVISNLIFRIKNRSLNHGPVHELENDLSFFLRHYEKHINDLNEEGSTLLGEVIKDNNVFIHPAPDYSYGDLCQLLRDHGATDVVTHNQRVQARTDSCGQPIFPLIYK